MTEWLAPVLDPSSRTFWPLLVGAALVAMVHHLWTNRHRPAVAWKTLWRATVAPHLWGHPSSRLDLQLLVVRRALTLLFGATELGLAYTFATSVVRTLDGVFGIPVVPMVSSLWLTVGYTLVLFVVWDLSRYVLHRAMHEIDALWQIHQVHHSAQVLTPFTFHRIHPLEGLLYGARGVIVDGALAGLAFWLFRGDAVQWSILGVHGIGFLLNAFSGNLRHSHVWWRFGPSVERWLLSPAQHQLHHGLDAVHVNYGTWLAVWDRWGGSWVAAPARRPPQYGLSERNHEPDDLLGALVGPVRRWIPVGWLAWAGFAQAQEGPTYEIVVVGDEGVPRVAGSAYVVDEEELERTEYNDVHRVLAAVPGVYVRGEDGFGLRPNIGMRGANSDRSSKIALLEDGIPLAPAPYAAPAAYYFPLTTRIAGVEVFKGPAALEHGPQTIGGAVNLLSRAIPARPGGYANVGFGSYRTLTAHVWGGASTDQLGFLVEGAHLSTGGFKALDGGGPTGFARQDVLVKARAATTPGELTGTVELELGVGREQSHETYLGLTYADWLVTPLRRYAASQDDVMNWNRTSAELFANVDYERTRVDGAVWIHRLDRVWTKLNRFAGGPDLHDLLLAGAGGASDPYLAILQGEADSTTDDQVLLIGTNDRTFVSSGGQAVLRTEGTFGPVTDRLTAGVRWVWDDVRRLHTEDPFGMTGGELLPTGGPTETLLDSATRANALAAWIQDTVAWGPVQILPGARLEWITTAAGTAASGPLDPQQQVVMLPGVGASVSVARWLDGFAGVHRGFSPVAPGQDESVDPEMAVNAELGLRAVPGETHAELVGYLSRYENIVGACTLSGGCSDDLVDQQFNGGAALVYGLETLATHTVHLPARFELLLSATYTWTHGEFLTGFVSAFPQFGSVVAGDRLPYVPEHQGSLRFTVLHERGSFTAGAIGRSGMWDEAGQGPLPEIGSIPPLLLVDVAADARLAGPVRVYATVTNLTNSHAIESWRPFGARPTAPFTAFVGLKLDPQRGS